MTIMMMMMVMMSIMSMMLMMMMMIVIIIAAVTTTVVRGPPFWTSAITIISLLCACARAACRPVNTWGTASACSLLIIHMLTAEHPDAP